MALLVAAHRYNLPKLVEMATTELLIMIEWQWMSPKFPDAIRALYEECSSNFHTRQLRESVVSICLEHESQLTEGRFRSGFCRLVTEVPLFGIDFIKASKAKILKTHEAAMQEVTRKADLEISTTFKKLQETLRQDARQLEVERQTTELRRHQIELDKITNTMISARKHSRNFKQPMRRS